MKTKYVYIALGLLAAGGIGYYFYNQHKKNNTPSPSTQPTAQQKISNVKEAGKDLLQAAKQLIPGIKKPGVNGLGDTLLLT